MRQIGVGVYWTVYHRDGRDSISGENLFNPEMSYPLRGFQGSFPDRLGLAQPSQDLTRYREYVEVIFRTQAFNGVYLNAGDSD